MPVSQTCAPLAWIRRAGVSPRPVQGPAHVNGAVELSWVERGRLELITGRRVIEGHAGEVVVLAADVENVPRVANVVVHQLWLPPPLLDEAAHTLQRPAGATLSGGFTTGERGVVALMRLMADEIAEGAALDDPALKELQDALCLNLLRAGPCRRRPPDARIRRALDLVGSAYGQPVGVEDMAAAAGMPRFSFTRAFRAQTGESPYQHLTRIRLERAADRLRATHHSVLQVALACGFGDPGRFARAFRARYGATPRRWRLAMRG